jgi:chromosome segregation ATPase
MKFTHFLHTSLWLAACSVAMAQSAPAANAAGGNTRSLGSGTGGGPLLTREELRACLNQGASMRTRTADLDGQRAALNQEKDAIATEQQSLREARAPIEAMKPQTDDLNQRMRVFKVRVDDWTARAEAFNASGKTGVWADRESKALQKERKEIEAERVALDAERERLAAASKDIVGSYNERAAALEARVKEWNRRNEELNKAASALEDEREKWVTGCADRRYREDDEIAIKAGK